MTEKKVTHEIKIDRPVRVLLWGLVFVIGLNALPQASPLADALAELSSNPLIQLHHSLTCSGCN